MTTDGPEKKFLFARLDTFCKHTDIQVLRHSGNSSGDGGVTGVSCNLIDESSVYFEQIDGEMPQIVSDE